MNLRGRLILVFLAATAPPLAATWWLTTSLLENSLSYSTIDQVDELSRMVQKAGHELYQNVRESLRADAAAGRIAPQRYAGDANAWPRPAQEFWESGEAEHFAVSGAEGDLVNYLVRRPDGVWSYTRGLGVSLARISDEYRRAREAVGRERAHDLRRGFRYTFVLLGAAVWLVSLGLLVFLAHRVSRPIGQLTAGLERLAAGDLATRLETRRRDEAGRAIRAFNHMASQLQQSRDRLVYLTQLASWQMLARKMAHELKNSLTPIRLTMEEVLARQASHQDRFLSQAARIIVDEVESLQRRVRAFSEFSAEPPVRLGPVHVNAAIEERVAFLKAGHPDLRYRMELGGGDAVAVADEDLLKGVLTNLLENAADAAGAGGAVLVSGAVDDGHVVIEVHDSGPGLSEEARRSVFEPTISFKKGGMGLGLSIARKNALLSGGDILLVEGKLGGAGFRVLLPEAGAHSSENLSAAELMQ
jgi:nitrogen fixation/metabolism regulation signal transduction histidine kinase